jgi:hypothetical protein
MNAHNVWSDEGEGKGKDMGNGKRKGEEKDGVIPLLFLDAGKKK